MTSFNNLLIRGDNNQVRKISIKRKDGDKSWESSWQEIDNDRIISIGTIKDKAGDDLNTLSYLTNKSMDLVFDNYDSYFNKQDDTKSFWYSSYYLHNSQIKVELGYYDDDGTIVWGSTPIYKGCLLYTSPSPRD